MGSYFPLIEIWTNKIQQIETYSDATLKPFERS